MGQTEITENKVGEVINYKGFEFKVGHKNDMYACIVPSFAGGCALAGTFGKSVEETLIRTTSILNNAFIQPAVTHPRVGDLFDLGVEERSIIVNVEGPKVKIIPLKDAKVLRRVAIDEGTVHPYLVVQNKVEDLSNEIAIEFPEYIILEDGVLHTNNFPMDVFVWKAKKNEE